MTNDRWQIHRHLAEQADQRLQIVKTVPRRILLAGADGDNSRRLLAARYPKAAFAEYDPRPECLRDAADKRGGGLLSKLAGKTVPQHCQALSAPLPEASADMLWSNLGLATEHNPVAVFASWAGALQTDGLLFFTHFGRDTLLELTDMHDLGDMLADSGFYDPVTDTARLKLEYRTADTFLQDMDTLGLWHALDFDDLAAARTAIAGLWQRQTLPGLTLETVFGHAVKKKILPAGENEVHFFPKKT